VSDLSFLATGGAGTQAPATARARIGAALLGVPLLEAVREGRVISPCWRCVISAKHTGSDAACWPVMEDGAACSCA
jgi:hypothetical protein